MFRITGVADRLVDRLGDPARSARGAVLAIAGFAAAWTLYGILAKASQGVHFDMAELADLARHPALGNVKNPPFAIWVAAAWFAVFPRADWAFYLLSMVSIAIALAAGWALYGRMLTGLRRVLALALITLVPLLTFQALKFNNNTMMVPVWAVTVLVFVRAYDSRRSLDAALAGVAAALAMMTKYWSVFLLAGLALAAIADGRRSVYLRSAAPWITVGCGAVALAPHLIWLVTHHFPSFSYALLVHGGRDFGDSLRSVATYAASVLAYGALPVVVALAATRPSGPALRTMLLPPDGPVRFIAIVFWTTLLAPMAVALASGTEIVALWTMPSWILLPVLLLSPATLTVERLAVRRVVLFALALPLAAVVVAPGIALIIHRTGSARLAAYEQPLAQTIEQFWHSATSRPMAYVAAPYDLAYGIAFYIDPVPTAFPDFDRKLAPWVEPAALTRDGAALVCPVEDQRCVTRIKALAVSAGPFQIEERAVVPWFFGIAGEPRRFVIVIIPPRNVFAGS